MGAAAQKGLERFRQRVISTRRALSDFSSWTKRSEVFSLSCSFTVFSLFYSLSLIFSRYGVQTRLPCPVDYRVALSLRRCRFEDVGPTIVSRSARSSCLPGSLPQEIRPRRLTTGGHGKCAVLGPVHEAGARMCGRVIAAN